MCAAGVPAAALERTREEQQLETSARELNRNNAKGQQRVADAIKAQFGVDDALLLGLHYRKLGHGDIAIALGLAQEMSAGVKDENLQKVVALRQGPPVAGWGKVAGDLGLKLGPVISKVRRISSGVRKLEADIRAKKDKTAETEKVKKKENIENPEKPVKAGQPEQREKSWKERIWSFMRS